MGNQRSHKSLEREALWEYALRILARRGYSVHELRAKIAQRAASAADTATIMARLREYGLANDQQFSETYALSRLQNSGFGKLRILRELRAKSVAPAVAEKAVQKTFTGVDENELIDQFLQRKYRGKNLNELLKEPKNLTSAYRKLRLAGFSSSAAIAALKRFSKMANELEGWEED
jgi:SOS response regulatory protein OraA/RecX